MSRNVRWQQARAIVESRLGAELVHCEWERTQVLASMDAIAQQLRQAVTTEAEHPLLHRTWTTAVGMALSGDTSSDLSLVWNAIQRLLRGEPLRFPWEATSDSDGDVTALLHVLRCTFPLIRQRETSGEGVSDDNVAMDHMVHIHGQAYRCANSYGEWQSWPSGRRAASERARARLLVDTISPRDGDERAHHVAQMRRWLDGER